MKRQYLYKWKFECRECADMHPGAICKFTMRTTNEDPPLKPKNCPVADTCKWKRKKVNL